MLSAGTYFISVTRIDVETADGRIDCYAFSPEGLGPWPPVILYMDAFGIRPQLAEMAQRLASNGYFVVVPTSITGRGRTRRSIRSWSSLTGRSAIVSKG
jgi:carboxymethylenebutenolidase